MVDTKARPCKVCGEPTPSKYGICKRTKECKREYLRAHNAAYRDDRLAYKRKYHQEHRDEELARRRKYHQEHRDEELARKHKYYQEHRDDLLAYMRKYRQKHHDEQVARTRKYYQENRDEELARTKRRIQRWQKITRAVRSICGCARCGKDIELDRIDFHHPNNDKLFGIAQGWGHPRKVAFAEMRKCWLLCRSCHQTVHQKDSDFAPSVAWLRRYRATLSEFEKKSRARKPGREAHVD